MKLVEVLREEHVIAPLAPGGFRSALRLLVDRLVESGALRRSEQVERLLGEERVRDVVHVGDRVLLPHMRTDAVDRIEVAIGVSPTPLEQPSEARRGSEQVVVLVLAPPSAANQYLQIVAALARALRSDATVDRIAGATSPREVLDVPELRDLVIQPRLLVRDIMTQRVFRVLPDTPTREVVLLMSRQDLKAVPVVGEKREVLGMVTDRDLLRHLLPRIKTGSADAPDGAGDEARGGDTPVREIMTRSVMCISEDQPLAEVVAIMINKDVERLPVVNEGRLTGFLTRGDVLRKLFGQ